jgi:hypothetical protein
VRSWTNVFFFDVVLLLDAALFLVDLFVLDCPLSMLSGAVVNGRGNSSKGDDCGLANDGGKIGGLEGVEGLAIAVEDVGVAKKIGVRTGGRFPDVEEVGIIECCCEIDVNCRVEGTCGSTKPSAFMIPHADFSKG